ncbi:hypothetical protein ACFWYW_51055 [Nonomuraea sp. NPDC059023]|uniref:hypothetical protein n=1 Tax=unclassified Nonomuraea TaxID=2593643 RepID=UPI00367DAEF9
MTVLERLVGSVRERADARMYAVVAKQVRRTDAGLPGALSGLLVVPPGSRVSAVVCPRGPRPQVGSRGPLVRVPQET